MSAAEVLVIDEDSTVRRTIRDTLTLHRFGVFEAADSVSAIELLASRRFDLVLLEFGLGGSDGSDLTKEIVQNFGVPVMIVSTLSDVFDKVLALELGADDYICKPFHEREFLARVRAVLRRAARGSSVPDALGEPDTGYRASFDGLALVHDLREVRAPDGTTINLTAAEYNLLHLFVTRPRRVLTRNEIMDALKGHEWAPTDRSIDVLVAKLRRKIDLPDGDSIIKTVRNAGYVFNGNAHIA